MKNARVYLVGAGPGDPGLLTLKGRDCLAMADCVIYDYLVNPEILDHAPPYAELIDVGKRGGGAGWKQEEINRLLVTKAREYESVVRLKGGDPFIFGRGGEEADALAAEGIALEIVPGVSAGASVPAYAGIPVTHRGVSSSVAFVTGHEDPSKPQSSIRWEHLARGVDTIVFFMGVSHLREIAAKLVAHGRAADDKVAIVQWGTYDRQKVCISTLGKMAAHAERDCISSPAIIVVGPVVGLRERLAWFEEKMTAEYTEAKTLNAGNADVVFSRLR
ncbi:MAG: uroporphyrinogen-III C-methyltransferase [Blastocatellales bacterium]|nr:uroporphyrinogen-III C-methyltransferase [Blastocatellales bacterium]